ncbi:uncharacterized protein LOC128952899 [Oppia nitens]|uniref:uncharacterized protein LOC128952899 n=1 Tax=Oppia nitens TaxID=1686743 RepID=UPI0023DA1087|nr:uncharacterized protein LOC128952899 [Oppia nitens]
MARLFDSQTDQMNDWLNSSSDDKHSVDSMQDSMRTPKRKKTTTVDKVVNLSPIVGHNDSMDDTAYSSVYDMDSDLDLTFDRNKSKRQYSSANKKWFDFSPQLGSTPKPTKNRWQRRQKQNMSRKRKSQKNEFSLWDKAMMKNPELELWINSFNEDLKRIESSELSVVNSSVASMV